MKIKNILFVVLFFVGFLHAADTSIIDKVIFRPVSDVLPMQKFVNADKSYFHKQGGLPTTTTEDKIKLVLSKNMWVDSSIR